MFKFENLKQIHLEITNNCQASCPMCNRNHHGGIKNPLLKLNDWTFENFNKILTEEVLLNVESLYFCGNFGDPIMNKDLPKMIKHAVSINSNLMIRIHTNGGIQNTKYWSELAHILPKNHLVIFGIDGLDDTNHLYRIGVNFKKVIANATSFIKAGGRADWAFIIFKHNQHQVEQANILSKTLGFVSFTKKHSSRFLLSKKFEVYDKHKNVTHLLEPSTYSNIVFIDKKIVDNYKKIVSKSEINCIAKEQKEIYIDAFYKVFPCCFIGMTKFNFYDQDEKNLKFILNEIKDQYENYIKDFGGEENITSLNRPLKEILNSNEYQSLWTKYWNEPKMIVCARTCGTNNLSKPKDQFFEKEKNYG